MTSSADVAKPNKRVKTSTRCWTCRRRKVKCDEHKSVCGQCVAKQLDCEGYGARLRWMDPGIDCVMRKCTSRHRLGRSVPNHRETVALLVCPTRVVYLLYQIDQIADVHLLPLDPGPTPVELSEVDEILRLIDAFADTQSLVPCETVNSLLLSNFGVFKRTADRDEKCIVVPAPERGPCENNLSAPVILNEPEPRVTDNSHTLLRWGLLAQPSPSLPGVPAQSSPSVDQQTSDKGSCEQEEVSPPSWEEQDEIRRGGSVAFEFDTDHDKTIHLPRVLQSVGQLTVQGSSSTTRDALRNTLLSISAFYLCNESRSKKSEEEAGRWSNHAIIFQSRAIKLLKDAVEGNATAASPPKYKELLATMLSMITINVMSGDNTTCGIHLDGTLRFLKYVTGWKSNYSPKARSLQRIYFYLRVIYESTTFQGLKTFSSSSVQDQPGLSSADPGEAAFPSPSPSDIMTLIDAPKEQKPSHPTAPGVPMSMNTYECIYGVPQSLLVLLEQATNLINQVISARDEARSSSVPTHLKAQCNALESDIVDWDAEPCSLDHLVSGNKASSEIIRKTTLAFHNALIIYFAQHIPLIRFSYLRPHVKLVLDSIGAIEQLKSQTSILAAPLYWPVFIAGSEAFDRELQDGFKKWYRQVEFYGIASARTGSEVLARVWEAGTLTNPRMTSHWRMVVERLGSILMLS
ncbi:hypothetical protein MCOR25_003601 [Pyricularia grisea]|nr:hypothetical protein MCOR25_003601 [Pyricularia grisea]